MANEPLTILGIGDSWEGCPVDGERKGELWGAATCLTTEGLCEKKYDKVFAFDYEKYSPHWFRRAIEICDEKKIPLVSTRSYATEAYPIYDVLERFKAAYLRNTVSYMLALAAYHNRSPVYIYGVDQDRGEYVRGKPFVTFWLGVMVGLGLDYEIYSASTMPQILKERTIQLSKDPTRGLKVTPQFQKQLDDRRTCGYTGAGKPLDYV